jgi:hypothetical protein
VGVAVGATGRNEKKTKGIDGTRMLLLNVKPFLVSQTSLFVKLASME